MGVLVDFGLCFPGVVAVVVLAGISVGIFRVSLPVGVGVREVVLAVGATDAPTSSKAGLLVYGYQRKKSHVRNIPREK